MSLQGFRTELSLTVLSSYVCPDRHRTKISRIHGLPLSHRGSKYPNILLQNEDIIMMSIDLN